MNRRFGTLSVVGVLLLGWGAGQDTGYLAQKLMLENSLRTRITEALSKVIDDRKYVVDVSVELDLTTAVEEQFTYRAGEGVPGREGVAGVTERLAREAEEVTQPQRTPGMGIPIPGFEFEIPPEPEGAAAQEEAREPGEGLPEGAPRRDQVISRTHTEKRPSLARVKKMDISIILQEGAAPELIENIRQVVMVASRFNRARGDMLSIMTASFKERRDEKTAEQILLKNIAEKLDALETRRAEEGEVDWTSELEQYKQQEAERREEDRLYFQSKLAELETSARERAFQQEKREILRQDSLQLQGLDQEIQSLKAFLGTTDLSDSALLEAQSSVRQKIGERDDLDAQIAEKLAMLDNVQAELDQRYQDGTSGSSTLLIVFVSLLVALVIVLVVVLAFVLMNRSRQSYTPPPWMYPPRPKKKSRPKPEVAAVAAPPPPAPPPPSPPPAPQEEDPAVLQSEIEDMKQAVVSMSVGQPTAATRIVKEWIQEEAPPPPEPEAAPPPAPAEEEGGKGKKKKKKK